MFQVYFTFTKFGSVELIHSGFEAGKKINGASAYVAVGDFIGAR